MATRKTKTTRPLSAAEGKRILDKYYSLRIALYKISEDGRYHSEARKHAKSALKGLEKWRGDKLNLARMTNYSFY